MKKSTIALIAAFIVFFVFQIVIVCFFTAKISDGMHEYAEKQKDFDKTGNVRQENSDSIVAADSVFYE